MNGERNLWSRRLATDFRASLVVIVLVAIVVYVALRLSAKAGTYMSPTAMTIFNRVMGLIIASIAIEFMLGGLAARFPILTQASG